MTIRLLYNVYKDSNSSRQKELDFCRKMNNENKHIEVIEFESQGRPTFDSLFERINDITGPEDINIIANTDIFFDETIILAPFHLKHREVWALSRWEYDFSSVTHYDVPYSHDAWIFRGKIDGVYGDFTSGRRGCDGRLNYEFYKAGYEVHNPSKSVKSFHVHSSGVRNYSHWNDLVDIPWLSVTPTLLRPLLIKQKRKKMSTTCLIMIVKDEAHVIERCLNSVKDLIDYWVIIDTGSTDDTKEVIQRVMQNIPGQLIDRPWINFGHNRTEGLNIAREHADYSLWVDADDILETNNKEIFKNLNADVYSIEVVYGSTKYRRAHLLNNRLDWSFVGFLHEYPDAKGSGPLSPLDGIVYKVLGGGARSLDSQKYAKDAEVLEKAIKNDPNDARAVFYLAQSYKDSEQFDKAIITYQHRIDMGGFQEEVWNSYFEIAKLYEKLKSNKDLVIFAYLRAYQYRPQRAESICELARYCRINQDYNLAFMFAKIAKDIHRPHDILFIDDAVYQWKALDEYAMAAYWIGNESESMMFNKKLLTEGNLPVREKGRVLNNLNFSLRKLRA